MQLVSKIFNLGGHDSPTSQTDRQPHDHAMHYSASRGNEVFIMHTKADRIVNLYASRNTY